jgi:hypothetical protein
LLAELIATLGLAGVGERNKASESALQLGHGIALLVQQWHQVIGIHALIDVVSYLLRQGKGSRAGVFHLHPRINGTGRLHLIVHVFTFALSAGALIRNHLALGHSTGSLGRKAKAVPFVTVP